METHAGPDPGGAQTVNLTLLRKLQEATGAVRPGEDGPRAPEIRERSVSRARRRPERERTGQVARLAETR